MRKTAAHISALVLGMFGAAVYAQMVEDTGSHIARPAPADLGDGERLATVDRARLAVDNYGRCVVARNRTSVARALATGSNNLGMFATDECLRAGQIRMPVPIMRGALYKALYRMDFAKAAPATLADTPLDFSKDAGSAKDATFGAVRTYADCVVRKDPAGSRDIVMAPAGSSAEDRAIGALRPALASCLDNGQSLGFSKAMLESFIAEVLYRESVAAPPASPTSIVEKK